MFVIFACFGCVIINHQKGGYCKENGPRAIWLKRFWCLMINITCGLMSLLVFVFVVHICEEDWTKTLRMQHLKKRDKKSLEVQGLRTKEAQGNNEVIHEVGSQPAPWWRTGQ